MLWACKTSITSVVTEEIFISEYSRLQDGVIGRIAMMKTPDTEDIPSEEDLLRAHGYEGSIEEEEEGTNYFTINSSWRTLGRWNTLWFYATAPIR